MYCEAVTEPDYHDELSAYLDGELSPDEHARVEQALSADAALRAELESLRQVSRLLNRHGAVDAPFGFQARVLEAVADEPVPSASWWSRMRRPFGLPIEAMAVVAAAAMVVVVVGLRADPTRPVDPTAFAPPDAVDGEVLSIPQAGLDRDAARAQVQVTEDRDALTEQAEPTSAPVAQRSVRPSPAPAPARGMAFESDEPLAESVARALSTDDAMVDVDDAEGLADAEQDEAPALFGASYRYRVQANSPDAVASLLRLVGRFGGRVKDTSGATVTEATALTEARSLRVEIPARNLAAFGDALRSIGLVEEHRDDRIFASSRVSVQVDLVPSP